MTRKNVLLVLKLHERSWLYLDISVTWGIPQELVAVAHDMVTTAETNVGNRGTETVPKFFSIPPQSAYLSLCEPNSLLQVRSF